MALPQYSGDSLPSKLSIQRTAQPAVLAELPQDDTPHCLISDAVVREPDRMTGPWKLHDPHENASAIGALSTPAIGHSQRLPHRHDRTWCRMPP
jgi:hypothetical protein